MRLSLRLRTEHLPQSEIATSPVSPFRREIEGSSWPKPTSLPRSSRCSLDSRSPQNDTQHLPTLLGLLCAFCHRSYKQARVRSTLENLPLLISSTCAKGFSLICSPPLLEGRLHPLFQLPGLPYSSAPGRRPLIGLPSASQSQMRWILSSPAPGSSCRA